MASLARCGRSPVPLKGGLAVEESHPAPLVGPRSPEAPRPQSPRAPRPDLRWVGATTVASVTDDRINDLRAEIDEINEELLELIARRQDVSVAIGAIKTEQGMPLYSHEREAQLLEKFRRDAIEHDLDPDYVEELMNVVLRHSRAAQRKKVRGSEAEG